MVFLQISQNYQENTEKEIPALMFSCELCEISHNIFLKEHFGRLLQHEHSICPTMTFRIFKNDVLHTFWLSIFLV